MEFEKALDKSDEYAFSECSVAYRKGANWAKHYFWECQEIAEYQNDKLRTENAKLKELNDTLENCLKFDFKKVVELEKENAKLRGALEKLNKSKLLNGPQQYWVRQALKETGGDEPQPTNTDKEEIK